MKSRKRHNGSITANNRSWPLYEERKGDVIVLSMRPRDKAEMDRTTKVVQYAWN